MQVRKAIAEQFQPWEMTASRPSSSQSVLRPIEDQSAGRLRQQRPLTAIGTQPRAYSSAGGLTDSALNDARRQHLRPATAVQPNSSKTGMLPQAKLRARALSAQHGSAKNGKRGLQRAWGTGGTSTSGTVRFDAIDEEGSANRGPNGWTNVGQSNPGLLAAGSRSKTYGLSPNMSELPDVSAGDPSMFEPIRMRVEADRRCTPKLGRDGEYRMIETDPIKQNKGQRKGLRPASAYQTNSHMSGMYVKRASGGIPEPTSAAVESTSPTNELHYSAEDATLDGEELQRNGDFRHAIPEYSRAIDQDPEYAPAYWRRGTAQWELGNYGDAMADYNELLLLDPKMKHSDSARQRQQRKVSNKFR